MNAEALLAPGLSIIGTAVAGAVGFAVNRLSRKIDKLDDLGERLARIEGELKTFDARWESLMNGRPSPSGRWPLYRPGSGE